MSNTCGITEAMAKAQGAPISIKPGAERLARVDAWAAARALTRHAALLQLVDVGLAHKRPAPPVDVVPVAVSRATVSLPPSHKMSEAKPSTLKVRVDTYPNWMRPNAKGPKT